jgi:hypothetical protein
MKTKLSIVLLAAILGLGAAGAADGEVFQLDPAGAAADAGALRPGLAVTYAYHGVATLYRAESYRGYASEKKTAPIKGFVYPDSDKVEKVMTADAAENLIAYISGFVKLSAGTHELEFRANDGLRVSLGGAEIYEHDNRHPCSSSGAVTVAAPKTAWYPLKALYFQGSGSACLLLNMRAPGGAWQPAPEAIYAHQP